MSNTFKISIAVVGAVIVGAVAGAGVFYFMSSEPSEIPSVTSSTKVSPTTQTSPSETTTKKTMPSTTTETSSSTIAFLYQTVGKMVNGVGENTVELGSTADGKTISSYGTTALDWNITVDKSEKYHYGDPVFSRLSNGNWTMTAWSGQNDPRGAAYLLYHEASCPIVDDEAVVAIGPSIASGCKKVNGLNMAKTSQVFEGPDGNYLFHMSGGQIYLAHLSNATQKTTDLESMCVLENAVTDISDLDYGESTRVFSSDELLLSDTAIAKRADGTWVLFIKGIEKNSGCTNVSICELCARNVYRTTSTDLINWSDLEVVVEQASVPEATTMPDGTVWLYFQDFDDACAAQDSIVAGIAPISGVYEQSGTYEMSEPIQITIPDEPFESNDQLHYATNGNPVSLPDADAFADFEACAK